MSDPAPDLRPPRANRVLLIASRKTILESLQQVMEALDCETLLARNRRTALQQARHSYPDLIVLDDSGGGLRAETLSHVLLRLVDAPLLLLVREAHPLDRLAYTHLLERPFSVQQLRASVREALDYPRLLRAGPLTLDLRRRLVHSPNCAEPQHLTPKLFALLRLLMKRYGSAVTRRELMQEVWHTDFMEDTRTLDVHIRWLRERIEQRPSQPQLLHTVRGVGYCLDAATS
mgnify:CR=1 FL=1